MMVAWLDQPFFSSGKKAQWKQGLYGSNGGHWCYYSTDIKLYHDTGTPMDRHHCLMLYVLCFKLIQTNYVLSLNLFKLHYLKTQQYLSVPNSSKSIWWAAWTASCKIRRVSQSRTLPHLSNIPKNKLLWTLDSNPAEVHWIIHPTTPTQNVLTFHTTTLEGHFKKSC